MILFLLLTTDGQIQGSGHYYPEPWNYGTICCHSYFLSRRIIYDMPYGRKRRSYATKRRHPRKAGYSKRKRYSRRRTNRTFNTQRAKWLAPIRNFQQFKYTYCDTGFTVTLGHLAGYIGFRIFRGNGPYDPDFTGVGVQPYGWDESMNQSMFNKYRTLASSISVYFYPVMPDGYVTRRLHALVWPWPTSTITDLDIADYRLIPYHKETTYDSVTESTKGARMKNYMSTKQLFKEVSTTDPGFSAFYNNVPGYEWFWVVLFYNDEFSNVDFDVKFDVKIRYYTKASRTGGMPNES